MASPLILKTSQGKKEVTGLKALLDYLLKIGQDSIDAEISQNEASIIGWIESEFPSKLQLIASLKSHSKEFSPQQKRELMVRELRLITL
jgi:hypothetical protein